MQCDVPEAFVYEAFSEAMDGTGMNEVDPEEDDDEVSKLLHLESFMLDSSSE